MMEPGQPDVIEQVPATGNPMKPTSGSYGDVVETERLKQSLDLPGAGPGGAAVAPTPPPAPGQPQGAQVTPPTGGVPDALMRPTSMPDVPASTPLRPADQSARASQVRANHVSVLQALVASPTASDTTKRWAEALLERYRS